MPAVDEKTSLMGLESLSIRPAFDKIIGCNIPKFDLQER